MPDDSENVSTTTDVEGAVYLDGGAALELARCGVFCR
jgi:hypothetical protein